MLSSTPEGKSGYHFNLCILDEVAEWNGTHARLVFDRMKNAGASRRGLMVVISTPQFNLRHIGKERYNYAKSVLTGERIDPTFLPVIYEIPDTQYAPVATNTVRGGGVLSGGGKLIRVPVSP